MNYIYDITLNFNKNNLYEFYEWEDEDNPEFTLKIPLFKIDNEMYYDIKTNEFVIDKKFLNQIKENTEIYMPNSIEIIKYACVFVCENDAFAVEFDLNGNSYMKSNLSLDEENEIIEISKNFKYCIIEYKVKNRNKIKNKYITRKESKLEKELFKSIENIRKNKEFSKLKYIFYEIYNEKNDDVEKIYNKLINIINNESEKISKLYEILDLVEKGKIMSNNS